MFLSTSLSSKNIIFHGVIAMVEQKNEDLEFQSFLTVELARKAQASKSTRTELSSYSEPGFQVAFINNFPSWFIWTLTCVSFTCVCASTGDAEPQAQAQCMHLPVSLEKAWADNTWVILMFLDESEHAPASGALQLSIPLTGIHFLKIIPWLTSVLPLGFQSNAPYIQAVYAFLWIIQYLQVLSICYSCYKYFTDEKTEAHRLNDCWSCIPSMWSNTMIKIELWV